MRKRKWKPANLRRISAKSFRCCVRSFQNQHSHSLLPLAGEGSGVAIFTQRYKTQRRAERIAVPPHGCLLAERPCGASALHFFRTRQSTRHEKCAGVCSSRPLLSTCSRRSGFALRLLKTAIGTRIAFSRINKIPSNPPPIIHESGKQPQHSIIWLHGLGADGQDFVPIAGELSLPVAVRFIFPSAPQRPVTINGGY